MSTTVDGALPRPAIRPNPRDADGTPQAEVSQTALPAPSRPADAAAASLATSTRHSSVVAPRVASQPARSSSAPSTFTRQRNPGPLPNASAPSGASSQDSST